jgi:transcriptional regulator with XRE-family HTH domain
MINNNGEIAKRIVALRESAGLTQHQLADRLGVTRGAVGNWEKGQGIRLANLKRIAEELSASFEWLAIGHEPQKAAAPGDGEDKSGDLDVAWLGLLFTEALSLLGGLPHDEVRELVLALIQDARTPPSSSASADVEARARAGALVRLLSRK